MDDERSGSTPPPANAFVPVPGCWLCAVLAAVARDAWWGVDGLTLRDWLSVTADGLAHRMTAHTDDAPSCEGCGVSLVADPAEPR